MASKALKPTRASRGLGSVYWSDSQERWVGAITLGRNEAGKQVRKVIVGPRGDRSNDAKLGVHDRLSQLRRERRPLKQRLTSDDRLADYLARWLAEKDLSEATRYTYGWAIDGYIAPTLGSIKLSALTRDHVRTFYGKLDVANAGKEKIQRVLHAALNDAVTTYEFLSANPATGLRPPKTRQKPQIGIWNVSEAKRFLRVAKDSEYFALFLLAIFGAMGPAELFGLKWRSVHFDRHAISVVANLTQVRGKLIYKETKTAARRRFIPLPKFAISALAELRKKKKPSPDDFVFANSQGGPQSRTNFARRVWAPLLKKAGVPLITMYGLRHSSASLMAAMGIPLLVASRALGHSRISTTADNYTHLFAENDRLIADKFDEAFGDI